MSSSSSSAAVSGAVVMPLGGGQEVGRSCILLQFRGKNVLLDCGVHPGRDGDDSLPFFDVLPIEIEEIDLVLITHFHLDHSASLPYLTEKTGFKGRVFMTHATKAVMRMLIADYIKLSPNALYDDKDLQRCLAKCEVVDYHQTTQVDGITFTGYAAGHVLGAAMFNVEIDGVNVMYTGDYSMEEDRHLPSAEACVFKPDVLIVESTYGVQQHSSRAERERRFTSTIEGVVRRGGQCLLPVFALGRAQELLLILDEYWQASPELHDVPIFYASRLASKALRIYQTFINMMNLHIRSIADVCNPFKFKHITNIGDLDNNIGSCVIMASPGMLQSGLSRQIFDNICDDSRNGVVLAGYSVEGTLAHQLLTMPEEVTCQDGRIKPRRCSVEYVSFSAHVDYVQNAEFIRGTLPDNIVLVHGEKNEMTRLQRQLEREMNKEGGWPSSHKPPILTPNNGKRITFQFARNMKAELVGSSATALLEDLQEQEQEQEQDADTKAEADASAGVGVEASLTVGDDVVLVSENFQTRAVKASELHKFTPVRRGRIRQRVYVPLPADMHMGSKPPMEDVQVEGGPVLSIPRVLGVLAPFLSDVFDVVTFKWGGTGGAVSVEVEAILTVSYATDGGNLVVEWTTSPLADMVADCVVSTVMQVLSAPAVVLGSGPGVMPRTRVYNYEGLGGAGGCFTIVDDAMERGCSHRSKAAGAGDSSSTTPAAAAGGGEDGDDAPAIKRMKRGLLDPSRALAPQLAQAGVQAVAAEGKAGNGAADVDAGVSMGVDIDPKLLAGRLDAIRTQLLEGGHFKYVEMNAQKDKLILRSYTRAKEPAVKAEAFVYMEFEDGTDRVHAALACEDAAFKKQISTALKGLKDV